MRPVLADVSLDRLHTIRENLERLDRRLPLLLSDAARPPFHQPFDRVVVDLPCSGTGTLRKNPELKWRLSEEEVERLSGQGAELLGGVAGAVRPGGLLTAITCSLEAEENEEVVARFLDEHEEFAPLDLESRLPTPLDASIAGPGLWRLLPGGNHDGFTVSVLRRR